jgi:hypothetical protein
VLDTRLDMAVGGTIVSSFVTSHPPASKTPPEGYKLFKTNRLK